MPSYAWSWVLSVLGLLAMLRVAYRHRDGFLIGLATEALWIAYAYQSRQPGFYLGVGAYGGAYAVGWWRWGVERG